jgi:hypothetical protein
LINCAILDVFVKSLLSHLSSAPQGIAFSLQDYCELVDTTGRIIRADKVDDEKLQNPYPQKTDRWDEVGQTTAIVGIPNKYSNILCFF